MGKQIVRIWDSEVAECFELFGGQKTAMYFEALRYRQQLKKGQLFAYSVEDIKKSTGLSYEAQKRAKDVLVGTGWIKAERRTQANGGNVQCFQLAELAYEATKKTPRRRNVFAMRQKLVNSFS